MNEFSYDRGGYVHQYAVKEDGFYYQCGADRKIFIAWKDLDQVRSSFNQALLVKTKNKVKLEVWLDPKDMPRFIEMFLQEWKRTDRGAALKTAFDFSNSGKRTGWTIFGVTLLFPALLSIFLLMDGLSTFRCNGLLANGELAQGKVTKVTKNRRGNYAWMMEFTTKAGELIKGKRVAFLYDEKGFPKSPDVTVVYAPQNLECWDISLVGGENHLNNNQRGFTLMMTLSFGMAFGILSLILIGWAFYLIRKPTPYHETFKKFLDANLKT